VRRVRMIFNVYNLFLIRPISKSIRILYRYAIQRILRQLNNGPLVVFIRNVVAERKAHVLVPAIHILYTAIIGFIITTH